MSDLNKKAFAGILFLTLAMAATLFISAGTLHYWQAWTFLVIFLVLELAITAYLARNDPKLLERRMVSPVAEKELSQKIIQVFAMIVFITVLVVPAIDHRFAWSMVPVYAVAVGDILVALGLLVVFFVFRENTFSSSIINVESGQQVISTGPYAFVRHPMYIGALIMIFGVPLALGSWWGLFTVIPFALVIVWRLLGEEKVLAKSLPGYSEYRNKVRYRLVPFIW